jgi:hypothetical protein
MDERRRKVQFGKEMVDATVMSVQEGGEHWNEYLLGDGSVIRMKTVVTEVLRLDGKFDPEGNPIYILKSANVVHVSPSERARRQSGE